MVQVAENMAEDATRNREIRALEEAVQEIAVEKITLLTDNNEGDLNIGGIKTKVQSVTEWFLN
jgi:hypothetical protein